MARQRIDASLAALARRRADLSSAHFGLAFLMTEAGGVGTPAVHAHGRLGMAVPKRQLKHAVDRNALRRVAREAWRLAPWGDCARPRVVLVKLRRAEPEWKTAGRAALKKAWRAELDELFSRLRRRLAAQAGSTRAAEPAQPSVIEIAPLPAAPRERRDA